jgi:hypothetical protein
LGAATTRSIGRTINYIRPGRNDNGPVFSFWLLSLGPVWLTPIFAIAQRRLIPYTHKQFQSIDSPSRADQRKGRVRRILGEEVVMDSKQLESVRQTVLSTLASLGIPKAQWVLVAYNNVTRRREAIKEDPPSGRIRVVWLLEKQQLEFFDQDGRRLITVPADASAETVETA